MGRPKGAKSKTNKSIKGIPKKKTPKKLEAPLEERVYYCTSCGKDFNKQKGIFRRSNSLFFKGNDGYVPICLRCLDHYERQYESLYEDVGKALDRICMIGDWYINDALVKTSRAKNPENPRITEVIRKGQLSPNTGKTYDDVIKERATGVISSMDEYGDLKEKGAISVPQTAIERWGVGIFSDDDYRFLEDHYKLLKKQNPNCDNNQEIFIKDLCYIKLQQMNSMRDKKTDDFKRSTELYRDTFKQAGLKTVSDVDSSNDETLGVTLAVISQYTPEEYYKDRKLYKDFDGLGEYISRYLLRPLKNLITGSTDRDEEHQVREGD